jgi:hypothetical protein
MRRLSNAASGAKAYFNKNKEEEKLSQLKEKHKKKRADRKARYVAVTSGKASAFKPKKDIRYDAPGKVSHESKSKTDWREVGYTNHGSVKNSKACAIM